MSVSAGRPRWSEETDAGPRAISPAEIFKLTWRALGKGKHVELSMPRGHQAK